MAIPWQLGPSRCAYADPFVSGNLLVSFSMNETDLRVSGTITK
jgi:hypothetical protein